jgi:hypothetical protein
MFNSIKASVVVLMMAVAELTQTHKRHHRQHTADTIDSLHKRRNGAANPSWRAYSQKENEEEEDIPPLSGTYREGGLVSCGFLGLKTIGYR